MKVRSRVKHYVLLIGTVVLLVSCGQTNVGNENEWEKGHDVRSNSVVHGTGSDYSVTSPPLVNDYPYFWEDSEYQLPTGKWYMDSGNGKLGYGLTTGTQKSGDAFSVSLIGHQADGEPLDRYVRVQLTQRDANDSREELIVDETVFVEMVQGDHVVFTGKLPEKENVRYYLSAEIIDDNNEVEDTMVSSIYVPEQTINATIKLDQSSYKLTDNQAKLTLTNNGPTLLSFGKSYTIEKNVDGVWRVVPLTIAFEDIGLILGIGDTYEQMVQIEDLLVGEYRVVKEIRAQGLEQKEVLTFEFEIK